MTSTILLEMFQITKGSIQFEDGISSCGYRKLYRFLGYLKHLKEDDTTTWTKTGNSFKSVWISRESIDEGFRLGAWLETNFAGEYSDLQFPETRRLFPENLVEKFHRSRVGRTMPASKRVRQ